MRHVRRHRRLAWVDGLDAVRTVRRLRLKPAGKSSTLPVPNTPSAASITATLPIMSLRVHSHTERLLPSRFSRSSTLTRSTVE